MSAKIVRTGSVGSPMLFSLCVWPSAGAAMGLHAVASHSFSLLWHPCLWHVSRSRCTGLTWWRGCRFWHSSSLVSLLPSLAISVVAAAFYLIRLIPTSLTGWSGSCPLQWVAAIATEHVTQRELASIDAISAYEQDGFVTWDLHVQEAIGFNRVLIILFFFPLFLSLSVEAVLGSLVGIITLN